MKKIFDLDIPESLTDACHRGRLALLVYDMQVGIASQIKDSAVVIAKVRDAIVITPKDDVAVTVGSALMLLARAEAMEVVVLPLP